MIGFDFFGVFCACPNSQSFQVTEILLLKSEIMFSGVLLKGAWHCSILGLVTSYYFMKMARAELKAKKDSKRA